jgi:hypothetical protein
MPRASCGSFPEQHITVRPGLLIERLMPPRTPNVFAITWILAMVIIGFHISQSWDFSWLSNPDQDLVFLRDGLRLFNLSKPGYGDHPGLIQMLIGAGSQLLFKITTSSHHTMTSSPIGDRPLTDHDWQILFQIHKVLNGLAMVTLIATCSNLASKLLGRPIGLAWGAMTALSMGTTVLSYQLRNEFYSAYLFYAAALVLCLKIDSFRHRESGDSINPIGFDSLLMASGLLYLSLLAKVQVFPLIAAFNLGLVVAVIRMKGFNRKGWLTNAAKTSGLCLAIALAIQHQSPTASRIAATGSVLLLVLMPLVITCQLATQQEELPHRAVARVSTAFGLATAAYTLIVDRFHWQTISWDPYAMSRYRIDQHGTCTAGCYAERMVDGISGLFERSFDGLLIAQILSIAVPVMLLISLAKTNATKQRESLQARQCDKSFWAVCLCGAAIAMSMVASIRWTVDHYLPYQQPLLYLGLLIAAASLWPKGYWKILTAYALTSLMLINLRYPPLARQTFIKYEPKQLEERLLINGTISDSEPICWQQHAGKEWNHSILGRACRW